MTAAVFDIAAVRARRLELFPAFEPTLPLPSRDREQRGTAREHCGICPKHPDEICHLSCIERAKLVDGVTVT